MHWEAQATLPTWRGMTATHWVAYTHPFLLLLEIEKSKNGVQSQVYVKALVSLQRVCLALSSYEKERETERKKVRGEKLLVSLLARTQLICVSSTLET